MPIPTPEYIVIGGKRLVCETFVADDGATYYVPTDKLAFGALTGLPVDVGNPLPVTDAALLAQLQATLSVADATAAAKLASIVSLLGGTLQTHPTSSGDVAATLLDGRQSVQTPGTPVPLASSATPCLWVLATARTSNIDQVNVGGNTVSAVAASSTGTPLTAGQSVTLPVSDVSHVYIDARLANEGVTFTYGTTP